MKSTLVTTVLTVVPLICIASLLLGCQTISQAQQFPAGSPFGQWGLVELNGTPVASQLPEGAKEPELSIGTDGSISGFSGVNRFTGALDVDALSQGVFKTDGLASTRRMGPPKLQAFEDKLLAAINSTNGLSIPNPSTMALKHDGKEVARFARLSSD